MAGQRKYHMIFLDHMMPEMDGIETLRALKQMESGPNADTPVIMLTANAILGVREEYLKEGFADYLSKPVQGSHLEAMIRKYLPPAYILDGEAVRNLEEKEKEALGADGGKVAGFDFLNTKKGMMYCGDNEEFYLEILKTFVESEKSRFMEQYYAEQDWDNYRIQVHSLKSSALSIGAEKLSEHARTVELAVKEGRLDYVHQEHESLLIEYREIIQKIKDANT